MSTDPLRTQLDEEGLKRAGEMVCQLSREREYRTQETARRIVEAYLTEPPKWPTDESLGQVWNSETSLVSDEETARGRLREAFLADPIIKAALALRGMSWDHGEMANGVAALMRAIEDVGL